MLDVLLVDDEVIFLDFLKQAIDWGSFGCRICACEGDGAKAYEYIARYEPHIAFLDICMPQKDGLAVCRLIRENKLPTRAVIMTGHDEFTFAYQAIKLGIEDYLLKPFTAAELGDSLAKVVARIAEERGRAETALQPTPPAASYPATKHGLLAAEIDSYLFANYHRDDLTLEKIASALQFESSYLRRIYKQQAGTTISQRLEEIRMGKAKELLETGLYWNKEIAGRVGFADQYYFSKRFKQSTGLTPTEYRNQTLEEKGTPP